VKKKWVLKEFNHLLRDIMVRQLNISPLLVQILLNRGLFSVEEAARFLYADLSSLYNPFILKDMDPAVKRILTALQRKEKILVYGDYDVDGITGTVILFEALKQLGGKAGYHIPHRLKEGYGLHQKPIQQAAEAGFTLVITVDCGISGADVVNWSNKNNGPDFIITDHHQVPADLPPALAVINPRQADCNYPFKDLAGAGVALKLVQALLEKTPGVESAAWQRYLDLVCLGTIADVVPLQGENRIFVKHGISCLTGTNRPGLKALLKLAGAQEDKVSTRDISFGLAPRLNAAGRMEDASVAVELLLCPNPDKADQLAAQLDKFNQQRQETEQKILKEALQMLESDPIQKQSRIILLASPKWHPGVIGIVASRLADLFYRPALLVSLEGEQGKGSGRSIPGFHLYNALFDSRHHLLSYGGHAQAAGFTIKADELKNFYQSLTNYMSKNTMEDLFVPSLEIDALASFQEISGQLVNELNLLSPFGNGNREPVLGSLDASILRLRKVGHKKNHLKLFVKKNGVCLDGIGFHLAGLNLEITEGEKVNLAYTPVLDQYDGKTRVQLKLKSICRNEDPINGLENVSPALQKTQPENPGSFLPDALFTKKVMVSLPDFALFWLKNYAQNPGHAFLPAWFAQITFNIQEAAASLHRGPKTDHNFKIIDMRHTPCKLSRLENLVTGKKSAVILVNCPYQTVELAACLNQAGLQVTPFHPQISKARSIDKGRPITTTTGGLTHFPPGWPVEQLIIYHLPFSRLEWLAILDYARNFKIKEIYLLFGHEDRQIMEHHLTALAPDRNTLAFLYILLQRWDTKTKKIEHNLTQLTGALRRKGLIGAQEYTVNISLAIFYELGLLKKDRSIYLAPAPEKKMNVNSSPTFDWGEKAKKQNLKWYEQLLEYPGNAL